MADPDQSAVYAAERRTGLTETTARIEDTAHARRVIDTILSDRQTRKFFPDLPVALEVKLTTNERASWAFFDPFEPRIGLGVGGRNLYTLIHEIAHFAAGEEYGHGQPFRYALTWLVRRHLTIVDWANLTYEFDAAKLAYVPS